MCMDDVRVRQWYNILQKYKNKSIRSSAVHNIVYYVLYILIVTNIV